MPAKPKHMMMVAWERRGRRGNFFQIDFNLNWKSKSLQLVQNPAASLNKNQIIWPHYSYALSSSYWLPINARSDFQVLQLSDKILHHLTWRTLMIPTVVLSPPQSSGAGLKNHQQTEHFLIERPICGTLCHLRNQGSWPLKPTSLRPHLAPISVPQLAWSLNQPVVTPPVDRY